MGNISVKIKKTMFKIKGKRIRKLHNSEKSALNWLEDNCIFIDPRKIGFFNKPDFITFNGQEYEIKKLTYGKSISFGRNQINLFKDECKVIIMKDFQLQPEHICSMFDVRQAIKNNEKLGGFIKISITERY